MTYEFKNPSNEVIYSYLEKAKNIAVVGLSDDETKTSNRVAKVLQDFGYKIIPVNPSLAGQEVLGEKAYASIKDIPVHIDIVDVFRRSEFLPQVAEEFIATDADVFWAQLGLQNEEAEEILRSNGKNEIVMNRCIKIELANSGLVRK